MSRADFLVHTEADRDKMIAALKRAPIMDGFTVTAKRSSRTIPQNARMWVMLTIISKEVEWHGAHLSPEDWKILFMQALGHEMRIAPNIAGNGIVSLGGRSSKLTKEEFSDLMELISAFAAERGVDLGKDQKESPVTEAEKPGELPRTSDGAMEWARQWAAWYLTLPKDQEDAFIDETSTLIRVCKSINPATEDVFTNAINYGPDVTAEKEAMQQ